ncbi:hypothetical protein V501_07398 [Pseudogymnoascus sp. VKM F-4519 (FW-2642)]|nr:hypothetical protein V501_07398 [Pseudogymnoascus sp. VKM F-4519 (FW-2642)]
MTPRPELPRKTTYTHNRIPIGVGTAAVTEAARTATQQTATALPPFPFLLPLPTRGFSSQAGLQPLANRSMKKLGQEGGIVPRCGVAPLASPPDFAGWPRSPPQPEAPRSGYTDLLRQGASRGDDARTHLLLHGAFSHIATSGAGPGPRRRRQRESTTNKRISKTNKRRKTRQVGTELTGTHLALRRVQRVHFVEVAGYSHENSGLCAEYLAQRR